MRKGCIVRFQLVEYREVSNGQLFPYPVDNRLMRRATAHKELQRLQEQDFANVAMYGLARWTLYAPDPSMKHYDIEK